MMKQYISMSVALLVSLALVSSVQATTILVDFGHGTQTTSSTDWNNISGTSTTGLAVTPIALNDITNTGTGITLGLTSTGGGSAGFSGTGANWNGPYPAAISSYPMSALQDSIYVSSSATITATLANLNPAATYDFLLYGSNGSPGTVGTTTNWTVTGANSDNGSIAPTFENSTQVVNFSDIIPDGSKEITFLMTATTGSPIGRWNILRITENLAITQPEAAVPEPATCTLLLCGLGIFLRRRRVSRTESN